MGQTLLGGVLWGAQSGRYLWGEQGAGEQKVVDQEGQCREVTLLSRGSFRDGGRHDVTMLSVGGVVGTQRISCLGEGAEGAEIFTGRHWGQGEDRW